MLCLVKLPHRNDGLRRALDPHGFDAYSHREEVRRLETIYRHSIRFDGMHHYETCVPYALALTDDPTYEGVRHAHRSIFAGADFMAWMIERHLDELHMPQPGCLVCYFSGDRWKHVGLMLPGQRVRSKWGVMPRYEHGIDEVPDTYGDDVRFYARPTSATAKVRFSEFAIAQGLTDRDIRAAAVARR
jgi:hypothetical protein